MSRLSSARAGRRRPVARICCVAVAAVLVSALGCVPPPEDPEPLVVASVTVGAGQNCVVTPDGNLACWGENRSGSLGTDEVQPEDGFDDFGRTADPVQLDSPSGIRQSSAGHGVTCGVDLADTAWCWGAWSPFESFLDDPDTRPGEPWFGLWRPRQVPGLDSGVRSISVGFGSACAVTNGGAATCWRTGLAGSTSAHGAAPEVVPGLGTEVSSVAAGGTFSCALTELGAVWCWGSQNSGALYEPALEPVAVPGLESGVEAISVGFGHGCALSASGAVKCWGDDGVHGILGNPSALGSTTDSPVAVVGLEEGVDAISAGAEHSCAVTAGGAVKCWGRNDAGQLGGGTIDGWGVGLTEVVGLTAGVTQLDAGSSQTCALVAGEPVRCWGWNAATEQPEPSPSEVPGTVAAS